MAKYKELPRRKIRYWLYRFRTEATGGAKATNAPRGMKVHFESKPYFDGWDGFRIGT